MAEKKKESWWLEPYHLLKMMGEGVLLAVTIFKSGLTAWAAKPENTDETAAAVLKAERARFSNIAAEMKEDEFMPAWRRFLLTGMLIEVFLGVFALAHLVEGSWFVGIQLLALTGVSIVFFGYKPWIIRNKRHVSFARYIRLLKTDVRALGLWYSYKGVE